MVDNEGGSGQGGPPEPPARRPGEGAPSSGEPAGRTPEVVGPRPRASVLRQPTITVEPGSIRANPGAASELTIGVTNNSDTVEEFTVEIDDRSVGWIRIEPPTKNLFPGARDVFRVIVTPPRSADVRAGLKQYGLTIRSTGIPGGSASAAIQVEVLPFESVEPRLVPKTSSGFRQGRHRVEIRNQGSALWTAAVSATDPQDVLRIGVPESIGVGPGETINVPVSVRPRPWNLVGSTVNHPFTVVLDGGGSRRQLDGSMDQRPFIPQPLLIPLLAAAILIPVGLYLLGFIGGGGKNESSASAGTPTPNVTATATVVPTETPTESVAITESPTAGESPSASPTLPAGVAQWAADARQALLDRTPSFDTGDFVGPSGITSNTAFAFQRYANALLYAPVGSETKFVVIRDPILTKFISLTTNVADPGIGVPQGSRRNDNNGRVAQRFAEGGIACSDAGCFNMPKELYDTWFGQADAGPRLQVGYPIEDYIAASDPTERVVLHTDGGWVVYEFGTGATAVCAADHQAIGGTDPNLCSF